jgi:hypothetical protein
MPTDPAAPMTARERAEILVRDVCELECANPDHDDTLTVTVDDLHIIAERALTEHTAAVTAALEAAEQKITLLQLEARHRDEDLQGAMVREGQATTARLAAERQLGNLLARIHRDGGHYQSSHGTEKACADAETVVGGLLAASDQLEAAERRVAELEESTGWSSAVRQAMANFNVGMDFRRRAETAEKKAIDSERWRSWERERAEAAEHRVAEAVTTEREACARIVERWSLPTIQTPSMWLVDKAGIAAAIRARATPAGQGEER